MEGGQGAGQDEPRDPAGALDQLQEERGGPAGAGGVVLAGVVLLPPRLLLPAPALVHDSPGRGEGEQQPVLERRPPQVLRDLRPPRDVRASLGGPRE
eukprot:4811795-Lingulodinium_polyedra.AAC.1